MGEFVRRQINRISCDSLEYVKSNKSNSAQRYKISPTLVKRYRDAEVTLDLFSTYIFRTRCPNFASFSCKGQQPPRNKFCLPISKRRMTRLEGYDRESFERTAQTARLGLYVRLHVFFLVCKISSRIIWRKPFHLNSTRAAQFKRSLGWVRVFYNIAYSSFSTGHTHVLQTLIECHVRRWRNVTGRVSSQTFSSVCFNYPTNIPNRQMTRFLRNVRAIRSDQTNFLKFTVYIYCIQLTTYTWHAYVDKRERSKCNRSPTRKN